MPFIRDGERETFQAFFFFAADDEDDVDLPPNVYAQKITSGFKSTPL